MGEMEHSHFKALAQCITLVFQRGAQEGHTVPLGNRLRTVLELAY